MDFNVESYRKLLETFFSNVFSRNLTIAKRWINKYVKNPEKCKSYTICFDSQYNDEGHDYTITDIIPWDENGEELQLISGEGRMMAKVNMPECWFNEYELIENGINELLEKEFGVDDEYFVYDHQIDYLTFKMN